MNPTQIEDLGRRLMEIQNIDVKRLPEAAKIGLAKRAIMQGFGGYMASVGARGTSNLADLIPQE